MSVFMMCIHCVIIIMWHHNVFHAIMLSRIMVLLRFFSQQDLRQRHLVCDSEHMRDVIQVCAAPPRRLNSQVTTQRILLVPLVQPVYQ